MSEQDRKYIFTEDAKKAMVDRNIRNKRINDQAPNVNTRKRYNNNVSAATKTGTNKQMRPTEAITQKVDTPKPIEKTTEVNGQTAKEADTQKSKKIHGRDTPKTQPNSIKHSESTNRYNCQQIVGIGTTTQNKTTTQEQVNTTPQTTQTDITSAQEKQTKSYYPTEAKRPTQLTIQDTTSGDETDHYGREEEQHNYLNRSIDHDNETVCDETELEIGTSQPTHTIVNAKTDTEIHYPNKNKANKIRKSIRERNALHAINIRGKREINYKFNTKHSKTPTTKPEKVMTSNTNNTTNPQKGPQPQNNTSTNTTTPNHIGNVETTPNNINNTPIETNNNTTQLNNNKQTK